MATKTTRALRYESGSARRPRGQTRPVGGLVLLAAVALVLASPCREALAQGAAAPAIQKPGTGGPFAGIEVHGHWKIDVRNPDGTLVSHTEFENALEEDGPGALAKILAGQLVVGGLKIELLDPNIVGYPHFGVLIANAVSEVAVVGNKFVLRLTADLRNDRPIAKIGKVWTRIDICPDPTISPASCKTSAQTFSPFTAHTLTSPISLAPNQIIQATVDISFQPAT